jgi:hypothetical protein
MSSKQYDFTFNENKYNIKLTDNELIIIKTDVNNNQYKATIEDNILSAYPIEVIYDRLQSTNVDNNIYVTYDDTNHTITFTKYHNQTSLKTNIEKITLHPFNTKRKYINKGITINYYNLLYKLEYKINKLYLLLTTWKTPDFGKNKCLDYKIFKSFEKTGFLIDRMKELINIYYNINDKIINIMNNLILQYDNYYLVFYKKPIVYYAPVDILLKGYQYANYPYIPFNTTEQKELEYDIVLYDNNVNMINPVIAQSYHYFENQIKMSIIYLEGQYKKDMDELYELYFEMKKYNKKID